MSSLGSVIDDVAMRGLHLDGNGFRGVGVVRRRDKEHGREAQESTKALCATAHAEEAVARLLGITCGRTQYAPNVFEKAGNNA